MPASLAAGRISPGTLQEGPPISLAPPSIPAYVRTTEAGYEAPLRTSKSLTKSFLFLQELSENRSVNDGTHYVLIRIEGIQEDHTRMSDTDCVT